MPEEDPLIQRFLDHQQAQTVARAPLTGIREKADRIFEILRLGEKPPTPKGEGDEDKKTDEAAESKAPEPDPVVSAEDREELMELLKSLTWPVRFSVKKRNGPAISIVETPFLLTKSKEQLCFRLFRENGAEKVSVENSRWADDAPIIFFLCLHTPEQYAPFRFDLAGKMLPAIDAFWDAQILTDEDSELASILTLALWRGHRAFAVRPMPTPYAAALSATEGN